VPAPQASAAGWLANGPSKKGANVVYEASSPSDEESESGVDVCQMALSTPRAKKCRAVVVSSVSSTAAARICGQKTSRQVLLRWVVLLLGFEGELLLPGEEPGDVVVGGGEELMNMAFSDGAPQGR